MKNNEGLILQCCRMALPLLLNTELYLLIVIATTRFCGGEEATSAHSFG